MKFLAFFLVSIAALLVSACGGPVSNSNDINSAANTAAGAEYTDANAALADGTKLLDTGETDRAIEVLNQAVKLNPDLADAYFQLGVAYALVETRDAGVVTQEESNSNEKKPKEKKTNSEIAFGKAVDGYKKLTNANKEDFQAFFNLGRAYNKLNEDEDSEKAFEKAAELNPDDTEYQMELGSIRIKLAKYREAIAPLRKALELDPENVEAQELLEDAEAGRRRVDYKSTPKPDKNSNSNSANSNSSTSSNTAKPPEPPKTAPTKPPANRP